MRRNPAAAALMVLTAAIAVAGLAYWRATSAPPDGLAALDRLLETPALRVVDARLGTGQPHHAFAPHRSTNDPTGDRWMQAGQLEAFARTHGGDPRLARVARALAWLHVGEIDAAIDLLADAAPEAVDARVWTYLSAAYLERARPTDLLRAVESTALALELDPALASARFNRALALERVGLLQDAVDAWATVAASGEAGWWEEAATRAAAAAAHAEGLALTPSADDLWRASDEELARLSRRAVDAVRRLLEESLLPGVGAACASASRASECVDHQSRVVAVARAMASISPDRQPARLADALARFTPDELRRSGVAERLAAFGQASALFATDQPTAAAERFRAVSAPGPTLEPLAASARLYLCLDEYYRSNHAAARSCLSALDAEAAREGYLFLRGRIQWLHGLISLTEGNLARTAVEYDSSIAFMREAGDANQAAIVESLRATLLDQLGSLDDAWRDRITVLSSARVDSRRRHTLLNSAGRSCLMQDLPRAALAFQLAAVRHASEWGQPGALVESHLNHAAILQRLQRLDDARAHLADARRYYDEIGDPRARGRFEADLLVLQGEVLAGQSPGEARDLLARARDTLSAMQFDLARLRLERAAGLAAEALGDRAAAREAYARAVAVLTAQRGSLAPAAQPPAIDLVWDVHERLLALSLDDEDPLAGLAVAEEARAQVLHRFHAADAPALSPGALVAALPDRLTVVYFAVLEDTTVRWTLSRSGVTQTRIAIGRSALERQVRRLRVALTTASESDVREAGTRLHETVWPDVPPDTVVFVVPDGPLHDVPFGVLVDPASDRYLVQDLAVGVSPSLRMLVSSNAAARERLTTLRSALVVMGRVGTGPGLDPLPALPSAAAEASAVAATYQDVRVVEGPQATPRAFMAEAGRFDVVHFTGHAVADRRAPEMSRLFLAPDGSRDKGWLLLRDLEAARFERTALVVLAACETGTGRVFKGEGVVSLARPFLARGVAGVVQTQWTVQDEPSARLLAAFHRHLGSGLEPVVALQRAQMTLLDAGETGDLKTWPAYQYAGGYRGWTTTGGTR